MKIDVKKIIQTSNNGLTWVKVSLDKGVPYEALNLAKVMKSWINSKMG